MVGYISEIIAKALREWPKLKRLGVLPVRATEGDSVVVNTPLPAIAVHVFGEDSHGNTYIGGGIRLYFELSLYVMIPLTDISFSSENGKQTELLDLSEEVIRCIERSDVLYETKVKHDLNLQFDRMETNSTYAFRNDTSIAIDVHRVTFKGDVEFIPDLLDDGGGVPLKRVEIDNNGINKTIIE